MILFLAGNLCGNAQGQASYFLKRCLALWRHQVSFLRETFRPFTFENREKSRNNLCWSDWLIRCANQMPPSPHLNRHALRLWINDDFQKNSYNPLIRPATKPWSMVSKKNIWNINPPQIWVRWSFLTPTLSAWLLRCYMVLDRLCRKLYKNSYGRAAAIPAP